MIDSEIYQAFNDNPVAWENFKTFPKLYQRVRIDSIQRDKKKDRAVFDICLEKLIEQSEAGKCLVIGTIMADCLIKQQKILQATINSGVNEKAVLSYRKTALSFAPRLILPK